MNEPNDGRRTMTRGVRQQVRKRACSLCGADREWVGDEHGGVRFRKCAVCDGA